MLKAQGYEVDTEKTALGEEELIQRLNKGSYSALGIRSKTKVTAKVIDSVKSVSHPHSRLLCVCSIPLI